MAAKNVDGTPASYGEKSGDDPPISGGAKMGKRKDEAEEEEAAAVGVREAKRRKKCPSDLDKAVCSSNFSFNTNLGGSPEFTPKFGSFNLVRTSEPSLQMDRSYLGKEKGEEEALGGDSEGGGRGEAVDMLRSVDGSMTTVD